MLAVSSTGASGLALVRQGATQIWASSDPFRAAARGRDRSCGAKAGRAGACDDGAHDHHGLSRCAAADGAAGAGKGIGHGGKQDGYLGLT